MNSEPGPASQTVEELRRELAQARVAMEDFTYSVSHDLRASLRHVRAYLKILREELGATVDPAIVSHLDTASGAAAHMGHLMDGLLQLSKVGRAELQLSPVDLQRLVSDVRHELELDAPTQRIEWLVAPDLPRVWGDMALLGQMLACLLGNALKFTRDVPVAAIDVGWSRNPAGQCELTIRDNGVGFDARLQDRLFRVFQRLHSSRQFEGIGIGLALARQVVERHGGTIRGRGDLGPGCEISLTLPIAADAPA